MIKIKNKFKFSFFVALSAALVAGCAAYYSVFGLSQLFAGASLAVIIMASSLEISKVVAVSFLHRYWGRISKTLRVYLSVGVFVLISITSAGIYGFLSNAYQKTARKLEMSEGEQSVLLGKKGLFEKNILDNQSIVQTKTARLQQLNNLRTTQESRLDGATSNSSRNSVRADINSSSKEIQKLNSEIDTLNVKNVILSDSVNYYANKVIESKSKNTAASEVGPLKYIAELTGVSMDKVVNYFILLLIFVFDPLAVALVIATNRILEIEREDKKSEESIPEMIDLVSEPAYKEPTPVIEEPVVEVPIIPEVEEPVVEVPIIPEVEEPTVEELEVESEPITPPTPRLEFEDIKEIKERLNRGFSTNIPTRKNNTIGKIDDKK